MNKMSKTKKKKSRNLGRPKGDKRERTRAALIEAAADIIREKGWERASLEEVASRAGMTRGAIYGNFKHREELFLAVVRAKWKPVIPPLIPGATFKDYMHGLGRAVAASAAERRPQAVGALSFMLYALTHEGMRARVRQFNKALYAAGADRLRQSFPELPMAPEQLVRVLHALTDGLTYLRFLTPELITDDVVVAAFDALAKAKD